MPSLKSSKASQDNGPARTPRPPNAFLCFRSRFIRDMKAAQSSNSGPMMRDISKQAADVWNHMDDEKRQPYFELAYRMRDEHKAAYPDYKYTPSKKTRVGSSKSVVENEHAMVARRRPQTSRAHSGSEPGRSPRLISNDITHAMPTLCSSFTPPPATEGHVYPNTGTLYLPADIISSGGGQSQNPYTSYAESWISDRAQYMTPSPNSTPRPLAPYTTAPVAPHSYSHNASHHSFDQTTPQPDFASLCQWDADFSTPTVTSAPKKSHYRHYY